MSQPPITVHDDGEFVTLSFTVTKILDEALIKQIGKLMLEAVQESPDRDKLILNFYGVQKISSAMIGKIVLFYKTVAELHSPDNPRAARISMCSVAKDVWEVFKTTRLCEFMEHHNDIDEAKQGLSANRPSHLKPTP